MLSQFGGCSVAWIVHEMLSNKEEILEFKKREAPDLNFHDLEGKKKGKISTKNECKAEKFVFVIRKEWTTPGEGFLFANVERFPYLHHKSKWYWTQHTQKMMKEIKKIISQTWKGETEHSGGMILCVKSADVCRWLWLMRLSIDDGEGKFQIG